MLSFLFWLAWSTAVSVITTLYLQGFIHKWRNKKWNQPMRIRLEALKREADNATEWEQLRRIGVAIVKLKEEGQMSKLDSINSLLLMQLTSYVHGRMEGSDKSGTSNIRIHID